MKFSNSNQWIVFSAFLEVGSVYSSGSGVAGFTACLLGAGSTPCCFRVSLLAFSTRSRI